MAVPWRRPRFFGAPTTGGDHGTLAGIDLHSTNSVLAVIDQTGQLLRSKRLSHDLTAIVAELEPFGSELTGVAVEST